MGYLRFWLALAVLSGHLGPLLGLSLADSSAAVLGFFVISGFYMAMVLDGKYGQDRTAFYWNRLLRLWPPYLALLLASLLVSLGAAILGGVYVGPLRALVAGGIHASLGTLTFSLLSQLSMLGPGFHHLLAVTPQGGLAWAPNGYYQPNSFWLFDLIPQAWSLATELVFYALAPWIVRWPSRRLALLFVAGAALRLAGDLALPLQAWPWRDRLLPLDLTVFCAGILVWRLQRRPLPPAWRRAPAWAAGLALAMLAAAPALFPGPSKAAQHLLVPCLCAAATPWLMAPGRSHGFERAVGELSYPLYLCHLLVAACAGLLGFPGVGAAVAASVAVAYLIHRLLERPLERRFKRVPRPAR
jgi:peptidoglycan/LPS O-acetylase OafA/YrhL